MYNLTDYHIHSNYSWDAGQTINQIARKAKETGIKQACLTEHVDFHRNHPQSFMYLDTLYEEWTKTFENGKKIFPNLRKGIEVGEPYLHTGLYEKFIKGRKFDFIMASVHWIDGYSPVSDNYFTKYAPLKDAYKLYFDEVFKLVTYGNFDACAHLTLVHRNGKKFFPEFNYAMFKPELDDILKLMISKKIGMEINTSGLRFAAEDFVPDREIIQAYLNFGGDRLVVGSDCHVIKDTFFGLEKAYKMFNEMGIKEITVYEDRQPRKVAIK